ncbi:MAG: oligosaccharide flippase family protein [Thermoplasmatales archaeon]
MERTKPTWILIQNLYGFIIGYVTYFMIFRHAGVTAFGIFSFSLSFGLLFSFISDLGINTAHVRMIAAGGDKNEYNNALLFMKLILTAIYILVILTSVFIWTNVLHHGFESKYEYLSILVLIPYFISLPYVQANRAFFTGTMEAAKMSLPAIIESTVRLICILILIRFNVLNIKNLPEMALLIALSYSLSYIAYAVSGFVLGRPWNVKRPKRHIMKEYLRYSYPLMAVSVLAAIGTNIAQIILQLAVGSFGVGGYSGDLRIIAIVTSLTTSVTVLILPILTTHTGSKEEYSRTVELMMKYLVIFVTPITVFAIIFASPILNLWSSQLIPFSFSLKILLLGSWFSTISIPLWTHFNATGETKVSGVLNIISYLVIIILDIILIPKLLFGVRFMGYGVNGAAYASLISGIILLTSSFAVLRRKIKIGVSVDSIKGILISIVTGIPFYLGFEHRVRMPSYDLLALFVAYMLIYTLFLLIFRALSREEMTDIISMIDPRKLIKYALEELKKPSQ